MQLESQHRAAPERCHQGLFLFLFCLFWGAFIFLSFAWEEAAFVSGPLGSAGHQLQQAQEGPRGLWMLSGGGVFPSPRLTSKELIPGVESLLVISP